MLDHVLTPNWIGGFINHQMSGFDERSPADTKFGSRKYGSDLEIQVDAMLSGTRRRRGSV